jgi:hypothetical protein
MPIPDPLAPHRDASTETGFTPALGAFMEAISHAGCPNFDCKGAARMLNDGKTPAEAAALLNAEHAENLEGPPPYDPLDHDYSLNA